MKKIFNIIKWLFFVVVIVFFFTYTFDDNGRIVKFRLFKEDLKAYKTGFICDNNYYDKETNRSYTKIEEIRKSFIYIYQIEYEYGNVCEKDKPTDKHANDYKVTFDTKGGNEIDPIYFEKGETLDRLPTPVLNGFRFIRWEDKFMTPIYDGALIDGDITLYAVWEKID